MPRKTAPKPTAEPTKPRKPGRPARLDDQAKAQILAMIAVGCSRARAARFIGVRSSTLSKLIKRDPDFADELKQAEKTREMDALTSIKRAGAQSWRTAAWLLERIQPRLYGRPSANKESKRRRSGTSPLDPFLIQMARERCAAGEEF